MDVNRDGTKVQAAVGHGEVELALDLFANFEERGEGVRSAYSQPCQRLGKRVQYVKLQVSYGIGHAVRVEAHNELQ
jgi:hypothetical protein